MRWASKLGAFSNPKTVIQGANLGNLCKLSFEVNEKIKTSENTFSKYPIKICSGRKFWQVLDDSLAAYGNKEHVAMTAFLIDTGRWAPLQHSV